MNRRTLLKTVPALALPGALMRSRSANSRSGGNHGIWAAQFDGATRLEADTFVLGQLPNSTSYLMGSHWVAISNLVIGTAPMIFYQDTAANQQNFFVGYLVGGTAKRPTLQFQFQFNTGANPGSTGSFWGTSETIPISSNYQLIQWYADLTVPSIVATLDTSPLTINGQKAGSFPGQVQFYQWGSTPLRMSVGGAPFSQTGTGLNGSMSEVYLFLNDIININDPSIQAGFFDPATGQPPSFSDLSSFGGSAIPGLIPSVYLSGPGGIFGLNRIYGGQSDGTKVVYNEMGPGAFYTAIGQLKPPLIGTDPWGNIGI